MEMSMSCSQMKRSKFSKTQNILHIIIEFDKNQENIKKHMNHFEYKKAEHILYILDCHNEYMGQLYIIFLEEWYLLGIQRHNVQHIEHNSHHNLYTKQQINRWDSWMSNFNIFLFDHFNM